MKLQHENHAVLHLKAGEWVEVRSREEILATLDERGCLEGVPFMPEMLAYCGRKFRVYKSAHKTCDPANTPWSMRRLKNAVHLEQVRCDGSAHEGCEAGCLIFWKEAWLKRSNSNTVFLNSLPSAPPPAPSRSGNFFSVEQLLASTRRVNTQGETIFTCQATEVRNFTSKLSPWNPVQYIRDLRSGNASCGFATSSRTGKMFDFVYSTWRLFGSLLVAFYNGLQGLRHGLNYPEVLGQLDKTSIETLDLQPGELVQVRSKEEILATLDRTNRNRGLLFDGEMLRFCGGIYRVLRRIHHIVDERTGKMLHMKHPCIVLEGVFCHADYHRLCPRAIYHYWRENWLRRVSSVPAAETGEERETESCVRC